MTDYNALHLKLREANNKIAQLEFAADELAEAATALCQAIDEYTIEVGKIESLRSGFADQGQLYEHRETVDKALRQYQESKK